VNLSMKPLLFVLLGLALGAQEPPAAAPAPLSCPVSELGAHPFRVGELQVRIREFKPNRAFGTRQIVFELENLGSGFIAFASEDLVIVGRDGSQVLECSPVEQFGIHPLPQRVRLAPRAHASLTMYPAQSVKYPAKLYYGERLLAEIAE